MKEQLQPSRAWWQPLIPTSLLACITAIAYYHSLHYPFQFDDLANITKHFNIRHYSLRELFFSGTRWISYWLNSLHYKIGKFSPLSYRVGNLIIHMSNGLLVFAVFYFLLSRLNRDSFFKRNALAIASITAGLFLLHPVQTQTVSYVIQGELEGLATLATLLMVACFMWRQCPASMLNRVIATLALFIVTVLSCGTKEITIVSPLLVALVDWFFIAQGDWHSLRSRLWLHASLFFFTFISYLYLMKPQFFMSIFGLNYIVRNNIGNVITHNPGEMITPYIFFISQFKVILHYLFMFIYPFNISVEYDWMVCPSFFAPNCIFPLLALLAITGIIIFTLRRNSIQPWCFGMLWFAIAMAPRTTIMPSPELLVDYKTYLGSVGWLFVIASAIYFLVHHAISWASTLVNVRQGVAQNIVLLVLALPLAWSTYQRNQVWSSGAAFWANIIERAPNKARAYNNYGVELSQQQGNFIDSIPFFQKAIAMDRNYADPCNNLAVAYAQLNELDRAIEALKRGLSINPHYPEGYNNIASFYIKKGDLDRAEKALETALKLRSHYGKAHFNLGRVYLERKELERAWECFRRSCMEADFDHDLLGYSAYGKTSIGLQKYDHAITAYTRLLELDPNNIEAHTNLGVAYASLERFEEAARSLQMSCKLNSHDPNVPFLLGESLLMLNRVHDALLSFNSLKNRGIVSPQLFLRIANCHERLGNPSAARDALNELLARDVSDDVRERTKTCIAKLNEAYNLG